MISRVRHIVHEEPEYETSFHVETLASGQTMTMFHLEVFYFSPSILRQMKKQWAIFRSHCPQVLFCHGDVDDDKFAKFIRHFGFVYLSDAVCTDGLTRRIFVSGPYANI